jgi:predicted small lipoprotein YifL
MRFLKSLSACFAVVSLLAAMGCGKKEPLETPESEAPAGAGRAGVSGTSPGGGGAGQAQTAAPSSQ